MNAHVRDSLVTGFEHLIPSVELPDADDRHVVAAAIHGGASLIVTFNLKDFPPERLKPYGNPPTFHRVDKSNVHAAIAIRCFGGRPRSTARSRFKLPPAPVAAMARVGGALALEQEAVLQQSIRGVEKKQVPSSVRHDNTLVRPLRDYGPQDRVDVVLTNPPFGGTEERGIEQGFPSDVRTKETADLFLVLIKHILKHNGRAALVLPDGTLFGEGLNSYNKTQPIRIEEFDVEKAWWGQGDIGAELGGKDI